MIEVCAATVKKQEFKFARSPVVQQFQESAHCHGVIVAGGEFIENIFLHYDGDIKSLT